MAEREQISNYRHIYVGQFSALVIGLILIIGGILLIFSGHSLTGIAPIILATAINFSMSASSKIFNRLSSFSFFNAGIRVLIDVAALNTEVKKME